MKCRNCGAVISDTSKFCDQCGWKVVKERRCPECGAALREGTKFCPECGRLINGRKAPEETSNIPIADIEQNILSETRREIGKTKADVRQPKAQSIEKKPIPALEPELRKKAKPAPAPVKKRIYDEWDEEDEEDEEEYEEDGNNIMTIMSVVMAFLIFAVAVFLAFSMIRKQPTKDYGDGEDTENVENMDSEEDQNGEWEETIDDDAQTDAVTEGNTPMTVVGTLSVDTDVNVRDNPSTEGTNVLKVAKKGETYEYFGMTEDNNWYIILLQDGSSGYVAEKYVSVN